MYSKREGTHPCGTTAEDGHCCDKASLTLTLWGLHVSHSSIHPTMLTSRLKRDSSLVLHEFLCHLGAHTHGEVKWQLCLQPVCWFHRQIAWGLVTPSILLTSCCLISPSNDFMTSEVNVNGHEALRGICSLQPALWWTPSRVGGFYGFVKQVSKIVHSCSAQTFFSFPVIMSSPGLFLIMHYLNIVITLWLLNMNLVDTMSSLYTFVSKVRIRAIIKSLFFWPVLVLSHTDYCYRILRFDFKPGLFFFVSCKVKLHLMGFLCYLRFRECP